MVVTVAPAEIAEYVGFFGVLSGLGVAVYLLFRRSASLAPKERDAWRWVAFALLSMWVGVLGVGVLTSTGFELPTFGLMDAFFIGAYAGLMVGLIKLTRLDRGGQEWVLTLVDAAVGSIALAALVWNFLFHPLMEAMRGAGWVQATIAITYPVADVLLVIALLILALRRSNYYLDVRLMFFAIGAGTQVLADFVFLYNGLGQDFSTVQPAFALNMIAVIFLVLTGAMVDRVPRKREFPEAPTPIWALIWPYLFAGLLVGVHVFNYRNLEAGDDEIMLLDAVLVIGALILIRQVYVILRDRNRVDRKRAELVASVSHELRTPLTAMVGFLTLLDEHANEFPADARQEMIAEAADQARHMSRLVNDLLMLAKGDTSQLSLEVQDVRAMAVVTSVLRNTDPVDTRIDEELDAEVKVRVDPDRMKQALGNLLTNAVRYGGDRCLVVAKVQGRDLIFEVHDSGEGVPTRFESMIWEHFERGAHRLDAATPGLGIGLSIVQAVTESHGGRAEYRRSERLGGACFALTIPDCVVSEQPSRARVPAST